MVRPGAPADQALARAAASSLVRPSNRATAIVLLKGMLASLAGSTDPVLREVVSAVLADGLRPPRRKPSLQA